MRYLFFLLSLILFTGSINFSYGQATKPGEKEDVIRVDTQLIDVPIDVRSPAGLPVRSLKTTNFVLYEDGKKQEIVDFATSAAPFEVALLLDTSGSTRDDLQLIQRAAQDFINSLRPGDRVSVISFNTQQIDSKTTKPITEIVAPLTDDRTVLKDAVARLRTSFGTPYYDSVVKIVEQVFRDRPKDDFRGRRALVALTDGVDSTSLTDFTDARSRIETNGIISFFIQVDTRDFFENNILGDCQTATRFSTAQIRRYYASFGSKANPEKTFNFCQLGDFERLAISKSLYEMADNEMKDLAKVTGGRVFPVGDLNEARNAFKSVADEIGTKYTIGYYSSNDKRDGTYRKIKIELKGLPTGTQLRAREGYTAPTR